MKLGKCLFATIAVTVFTLLFGMLTCGSTFNWVYQLEPTNIWLPMEQGPGIQYMIGQLFISFLFVLVYMIIKNGIPGTKWTKGLIYGLCVFAIGILPGMWSTYSFMAINPTVVIYWTIWGLIINPLKGFITSIIIDR